MPLWQALLMLLQCLCGIFAFAFLLGWVVPLLARDRPITPRDGILGTLVRLAESFVPVFVWCLLANIFTRTGRADVRRKWRETPSLRFCFRAFLFCVLAILATAWIPFG